MTPPTLTAPKDVCVLRTQGFEAWVLPWGARLVQVWWLDAPEGSRPLTLGFRDPLAYQDDRMALGSTCGRYANRLQDAQIQWGDTRYSLDANHPMGHCIHGGSRGFDRVSWQVIERADDCLTLRLISPDGDMGFPGTCETTLRIGWEANTLRWRVVAQVDKPCPLNLVQHSYWNLAGSPDLTGHTLRVSAHAYHPIDERELPLPAEPVDGTVLDFRQPRAIDPSLAPALEGALLLEEGHRGAVREVADLTVRDLRLRLSTDQPYLHLYAGAGLKPTGEPLGVRHQPAAGLCLETEAMPNGPALGAPVWYGPGHDYQHDMRWCFEPR